MRATLRIQIQNTNEKRCGLRRREDTQMACNADKNSAADVSTWGQGDMQFADHAGTQIT
jgi:hypothetical protein